MSTPIEFPGEDRSNECRRSITTGEPVSQRTFTPSQAVLEKSAGVFHWTPEGRRLYDYSSGVLVANLGHNPTRWMRRFAGYMGWTPDVCDASRAATTSADEYFEGVTLTAYNAVTPLEAVSVRRLLANVRRSRGSEKLDTVMWAASGSEAIQKALWACLHRDPSRDLILATRHGFHGKKGLAGAVTGSEKDKERDPRVKFIAFPMCEVDDRSKVEAANASTGRPSVAGEFDIELYRAELERMWKEHGSRINCLITEPYLGGGGSYHPPMAYHKLLEEFCRKHDILLIFDEVQANFGRTGRMYAFEAYGIAPDFVVLGKGLGNGVPVAAVVGRGDVMASLTYGEASDTWSCNPLACAAVLATLDEFEQTDVLEHTRRLTPMFFEGLERLKETGLVSKVRGEGLVFGIEAKPAGDLTSREVAIEIVKAAYLGSSGGEAGGSGDGIHLLGPLAGHVIRVSPPMTITEEQTRASLDLLYDVTAGLAEKLLPTRVAAGV